MNARMPSCSVSSAPQETSHTRRPGTGRSRSISASATRAATPERLSLAPGTVTLRQTSAASPAPSAPIAMAARAKPRRRLSTAASVHSGPARPIHHCGGAATAAQRQRGGGDPEQAKAGRGRGNRAPRGLVLERPLAAFDRAQALREPLRGLALARRARRALDPRERLYHLVQNAVQGGRPLGIGRAVHRKHWLSPRYVGTSSTISSPSSRSRLPKRSQSSPALAWRR